MTENLPKASSRRRLLTDAELKAMSAGETATESLPGRGSGSIYFERRASGAIEAYYRRRDGGKAQKSKLGVYRLTHRSVGLTLAELRDKARDLARIAAEHGDVKAYLAEQDAQAEIQKAERQRLLAEAERRQQIEVARGSLADLFRDYIDSRRGAVRDSQITELERVLRVELEEKNPVVAEMKARDVRPDHIRSILLPIWDRGSKGMADKVRAYLHAAFQYGLTAEHSLARTSRKSFALEMNPAAMLPKEHKSQPGRRALTDPELRQFWQTITETEGVGPIMARLFQFVIATGGQRIDQIAREPWASYDLEARTLRLIDAKGRGGVRREHLVPLTDRALAILAEVHRVNGNSAWPWTTTGKKPITVTSPVHAVADWLRSKHAAINEQRIPHFTPRDLRRTCTQLMQRHGVDDRLSDLLQSHGQTGVVGQHYRNSPEAYLPEKRRAIDAFEGALSEVLAGRVAPSKVVPLERREAK